MAGTLKDVDLSCACPALPNGTPVRAMSFGSIGTSRPADIGSFVHRRVDAPGMDDVDPDTVVDPRTPLRPFYRIGARFALWRNDRLILSFPEAGCR